MRSRKNTPYSLVLLYWIICLALGCSGPGETDDDDSALGDDDSEDSVSWWIQGSVSRTVEGPGDATGTVLLMIFDVLPSGEGGTPPVFSTGFNAQLEDINSSVPFGFGMPEFTGPLYILAFLDDNLSSSPPDTGPDEGDLLALDSTTFQPRTVDLAGLVADDLPLELVLNWVL